jgi:tetratricopeptide (TPR) repeat protein
MKHTWLPTLLLLAAACAVEAATPDAGTNNPFELGAGSRALALSGAYAGVADDVTALFWNPAGLARLDRMEVSAMHINLFFDTPYDFVGGALPMLDFGTIAFGAVRLATGSIQLRDDNGFLLSADGNYDLREYLIGFGREAPFGLRLGGTVHVDQKRLVGNFTTGVGLDAGLQFNLTPDLVDETWQRLTLGLDVQNLLGTRLQLGQNTDILPLNVRAGLAYPWEFAGSLHQRILTTAGLEKSTWRDWRWSAGLEYSLLDLIAVRGGLQTDAWSAGGGVQYAGFALDYAVAGQELGLTHRFTLTYRFGQSLSEQRQERERRRREELDREASQRAEQAVLTIRKEMNDRVRQAERRFHQERQSLLAKQEKRLAQVLVEERQRQQDQRNRDVEQEYFKALHYFQGIKDYLAKQYKQALVEFETVAKVDPNYLDLQIYLARTRQMAGGQTYAMSEAEQTLYYQGIDLYLDNKFAEAIVAWKSILAREPHNILAIRNIEEAESRLATLQNAGQQVIATEPAAAEPAAPAAKPGASAPAGK